MKLLRLIPILAIFLLTACAQVVPTETKSVKQTPLDGSDIDQSRLKIEGNNLFVDDIQADQYDIEDLMASKEIKLLSTPEQFDCAFYISADGILYGFRLGEMGGSSWFRPNPGIYPPAEFLEEMRQPVSAEGFAHVDGCYFRNKDYVIFEGYILDGANPDTFRSIANGPNMGTDGKSIYVEGFKVQGDPNSFRYVGDDYFADEDKVYLLDRNWREDYDHPALQVIEGADPASFTVLDGEYSKDAKHVWYYSFYKTQNNGLLSEADPSTFEAMDSQYFGKDSKNVYYQGKRIANATAFENIQFEGGDSRFFRDNEQVFYSKTYDPEVLDLFPVISKNPTTFKILSSEYQTDGENVFYKGEVIPEADASTFDALLLNEEDYFTDFFKDKNRVYVHGKAVEVEGLDIASVQLIPQTYNLTDVTGRVYCKPDDDRLPWMVMDGAKADDFEPLGNNFSKSGDKIFLHCYPDVNNYYQEGFE